MPSYSADQLVQVKELAALFFTPREIAIMMEWDAELFTNDCEIMGNPAYESFYAGRLQAEVDLRKGILKMAKAGSSPAQTMAMELLKQSTLKMLNR